MKQSAYIKQYLNHFNPSISAEIIDYAREVVFKHSRYIFTRSEGRRRYGYCTHCNSEFLLDKYVRLTAIPCSKRRLFGNGKEVMTMTCPVCGSTCKIKASGRGRKYMVDYAYFVFYEKSIKNPAVIVARGISAVRDYRGDYRKVETKYSLDAIYIFEMGGSKMFKYQILDYKKNRKGNYKAIYGWKECNTVYSLHRNFVDKTSDYLMYHRSTPTHAWSAGESPSFCSIESIQESVKDTTFQYSTWESYIDNDMVKFFDFYSKYPCIEYLTKMGLNKLVKGKLIGDPTYHAVNWRGKNPNQVLKLSKQELREIRELGIDVTFSFLNLLRRFKKEGIKLSLRDISQIDQAGYYQDEYHLKKFEAALEYMSLIKAHRYFWRQASIKSIATASYALTTWSDYIRDCTTLEMDLTNKSVVFPRNLHRAHQNTIKQVQIKANKELDEKIKGLARKNHRKFYFEYEGLFIRPARGTQELIDEGKVLNHCVGTYAARYATGDTTLLFIRDLSEPDKPYFTMEIRDNQILQCRGLRNCSPDDQVNEFIEAFKTNVLDRKRGNSRVKVKIPA